MSSPLHVVGHVGGRNYGDELMMRGLELLVHRSAPGREVRTWSVRDGARLARVIGATTGPSRLIVAPGSSFHDYYPVARRRRQDAAKAAYAGLAALARARGWPVVFAGSLGPTWHRRSSALDRAMARLATTALLRDDRSVAYARALGARAVRSPDLAGPAIEALGTGAARPVAAGRSVLVCPVVDRQFPEWVHPLPETLVPALEAGGFSTLTLLASHGDRSTDDDTGAIEAFAAAAARSGLELRRPALAPGHLVDGVAAELAAHDLLVSARLHPAMTGLALGVPTVVAPYHPKLRDVLGGQFQGEIAFLDPIRSVAEVGEAIGRARRCPPVLRPGALHWDGGLVEALVG